MILQVSRLSTSGLFGKNGGAKGSWGLRFDVHLNVGTCLRNLGSLLGILIWTLNPKWILILWGMGGAKVSESASDISIYRSGC